MWKFSLCFLLGCSQPMAVSIDSAPLIGEVNHFLHRQKDRVDGFQDFEHSAWSKLRLIDFIRETKDEDLFEFLMLSWQRGHHDPLHVSSDDKNRVGFGMCAEGELMALQKEGDVYNGMMKVMGRFVATRSFKEVELGKQRFCGVVVRHSWMGKCFGDVPVVAGYFEEN